MKWLLIIVLVPLVVSAQEGHGDFHEAKQILEQRLPYEALTVREFELLGDYFMDLMTGESHEAMDNMMGGEGSAPLRNMHINIGRAHYVQFLDTGTLSPVGMMGAGMNGGMMMGTGMMGSPGYMRYGAMTPWYGIWALLFVALLALIVWLLIRPKKTRPLDIAKSRLANGDISKKQFDEIRKELEQ